MMPWTKKAEAAPDPDEAAPSFSIRSLEPEYREEFHGTYVELMLELISGKGDNEQRPRNVALTGTYGSGKSSILRKVEERLGDKVVGVSLSTLGKDARPADSAAADPLRTPAVTNAIQKEIVKQLLYRERPATVPGSRYRRIEPFRWTRAVLFGVVVAAVGTALVGFTGFASRAEALLGGNALGLSIAYACMFIALFAIALLTQRAVHNRVWIEKLTTASATVSLTNSTTSYFDQYLDEIVYFFEATRYEVVVIEDVDRFNDPYIFETLRELNVLLNNSKQIAPHTVTFVYAVKDSIFEQLGTISVAGTPLSADESRELAITNRTKFFDVVVPVVPFISRRNARDLLQRELGKSGFEIAKPLVDLVSRRLVDMRLIKNVHNEYGVFREKILGSGAIGELRPDQLFAMVVYKNLNLVDFEKIRRGDSRLDRVFDDFRALVNQESARLDAEALRLEHEAEFTDTLGSHAQSFGNALERNLTWAVESIGVPLEDVSLAFGSDAVAASELRTPKFWRRWKSAEDLSLDASFVLHVSSPYYPSQSTTKTFSVSFAQAAEWAGADPDPELWASRDVETARAQAREKRGEASFVRGAAMSGLMPRSDLTLGGRSFAEIVSEHLGTGLEFDLVREGFIDRNYGLYSSLYYDDTVPANARNFILHTVDRNGIDVTAEVGGAAAVRALIEEVGDSFFRERSVLNVEVFDHLLAVGDDRLGPALERLARMDDDASVFMAAYFSSGERPGELVEAMATAWSGVFDYLAASAPVREEERAVLFGRALARFATGIAYQADPGTRTFIEENYGQMRVLTSDTEHLPDEALGWLAALDVRFADLGLLSSAARGQAVSASLYEITLANVRLALGDEASVALDDVRAASEPVYRRLTADLGAYLEVQAAWPDASSPIASVSELVPTLNALAEQPAGEVRELLARLPDTWVVSALAMIRRPLWTPVVQAGRVEPTFENVSSYVNEFGLDGAVSELLESTGTITGTASTEENDRLRFAEMIVIADGISADRKAGLVRSLRLGSFLPHTAIPPERATGELLRVLVSSAVIEDSSEAFAHFDSSRWDARRGFILGSASFGDYAVDAGLSPLDLESVAGDPDVGDSVKDALVAGLATLEPELTPVTARALAQHAVKRDARLDAARLSVLARARVPSDVIIRLVRPVLSSLSRDELVEVLTLMAEPYSRLVVEGGWVMLPNTMADRQLADRLDTLGIVSSRDPEPTGDEFRVNNRRSFQD